MHSNQWLACIGLSRQGARFGRPGVRAQGNFTKLRFARK